jgi:hypothetical protein
MSLNGNKSEDDDSLERSLNASVRSGSTRPLRSARSVSSLNSQAPQVDSSILETVTLEQRDKFTVSSVVLLMS